MRVVLWIVFTLCIPVAGSMAAPMLKPPPKSEPLIVGTWVCDGRISSGNVEAVTDLVYVFKADGTVRTRYGGKWHADNPYRTDMSAKPAEIDWLTQQGKVLMPGVFKVDGDRLTICWNDTGQGGPRPAAIESPRKTATLLLTFKRVRPKD